MSRIARPISGANGPRRVVVNISIAAVNIRCGRVLPNQSGALSQDEKIMRVILASIAAVAFLAPTAGHAQSAYDYPWCAVYSGPAGPGGAMSCYYANYGQCMETMSGIGGYCMRSPYYRQGPGERSRRSSRDY